MTCFRFSAPAVAAAMVFSVAGGSLVAQPQATYPQASPGAYSPSRYAPPSYQQPAGYPTTLQPQASYTAAKQATLRPIAAAPSYSFRPQTARYAMKQDTPPLEVPPPPTAIPEPIAPSPTAHSADAIPEGNARSANGSNWESYVQTPPVAAGCNNTVGNCGTYGCDTGECDYGTFGGGGGCQTGANVGREWFFGVYGLYMGRDNPSYERLAVLVDSPTAYPYYPTRSEVILSTDDIEPNFEWGAEIRLGSTFGCVDECNQGCGPRPYAWEVVYWGLADDQQTAIVNDMWSDTDRMYGMIDYSGIQYDRDGAGGVTYDDRPVNDYFDHDMPINDPAVDTNDVRVLGFRARSNFTAQNLELNFIRFPLANCQSCDPCNPCAAPRFMVNGVCGLRYMRLDEDLQYAAMFTTVDGGGNPNTGEPTAYTSFPTGDDNNLFHDISTDNDLVGFQFGSSANWLVGSKWSTFCDTQLGIYGNRISNRQRVWSGGGGSVTWVGTGGDVDVRSRKTDVSFLGEARLGVGYQVACNCRWVTAYRVIAITGVALSNEQIPSDWSNAAYVGEIDSNDSIILHGLQTGFEWKY